MADNNLAEKLAAEIFDTFKGLPFIEDGKLFRYPTECELQSMAAALAPELLTLVGEVEAAARLAEALYWKHNYIQSERFLPYVEQQRMTDARIAALRREKPRR